MSNYPPGMTSEDWRHIDGEDHHQNCPLHEANWDHHCQHMTQRVEWDLRWRLLGTGVRIQIHYCPFCGDELLEPECHCEEITRAERDDAAERKTQ